MGLRNITLVGFMGTGKTNVGKILGEKLNYSVVDVDRFIEDRERRKINDIFEKEGETYFRSLEKEAIKEISRKEGIVITTGGGAVLDPENIETLKKTGWIVALFARPETIYQRVKNSRHRPLLKGKDMLSEIKRLLVVRQPFYEKSDFRLETDGCTSSQVAELILEKLAGKLL